MRAKRVHDELNPNFPLFLKKKKEKSKSAGRQYSFKKTQL
jgi:hypothetical protein